MSAKFNFAALKEGYVAPWPVKGALPKDGKFEPYEFKALFRLIGKTELEKIEEAEKAGDLDAFVKAFFVGLDESETSPMPFEDLLALVLERPDVRNALALAYSKFSSGGDLPN
jgi:hypothetical protein